MNYPFASNDKTRKFFSKNKNRILRNDNIIVQNNLKMKSTSPNDNYTQKYNSKSEYDLCSNLSEKDFYGTIQNFNKRSTPKNIFNNINRVNIAFKDNNNNYNQVSPLHNGNTIYKNYFFKKANYNPMGKISNQTHGTFFSRSSEKYKRVNRRINFKDNKLNDSFSSKNIKKENNLINSSDFNKKISLGDNYHKKTIDVMNSQEINNNNNSQSNNYFVTNYGYYTLGGTNAFGQSKTNQDSYLTKEEDLTNNKIYTFGVFDGHGLQGHLVSEEIKNFLITIPSEHYSSKQKIISMFDSLSKNIENSNVFDSYCSGSTAVVIHITKEKIICANCGDSRAILISDKNNGIIKMSRDHKPELSDEKKRIIASGGRVDKIYGVGPYRVWFKDGDYPGLAMSRSIGDSLAHKIGVSSIPEIKEFNLNNSKPFAIVVASDGVWEFMSNEQVKNILLKYKYNKDGFKCSKEIVEKARQIWAGTSFAIDDITCVTVFFDKK
jgi:serine/threonine protein phosphatase PrpC